MSEAVVFCSACGRSGSRHGDGSLCLDGDALIEDESGELVRAVFDDEAGKWVPLAEEVKP